MFDNINGARLAAKRLQSRYTVAASLAKEATARTAGWADWHNLEATIGRRPPPTAPHVSLSQFLSTRWPTMMPAILKIEVEPQKPRAVVVNYGYDDLLKLIAGTTVTRPDDGVIARNRSLVVMSCGIVDWWQGMVPLRRIDPEILSNHDYFEEYDEATGPIHVRTFRTEVYETLLVARWLASHMLFEGDTSDGPYLSSTPSLDGIEVLSSNVIGWKQSNNGSSFIAMDTPMPHLVDPQSGELRSSTEYAWIRDGEVIKDSMPPFVF